jgi:N-acetylneuraminic acid mutarotase
MQRKRRRLELEGLEERLLPAWTFLGNLPEARTGLVAATAPDGRIFAIGGTINSGTSSVTTGLTEALAPGSSNGWAVEALMPVPISAAGGATGADGRVYIFGGLSASNNALPTTQVYNPTTNSWTQVANMPVPRSGLAGALGSDGRLYAIGGLLPSGSVVNTVDAYDPTTNTWTAVASMPTPRAYAAAAAGNDGRIYVFGGQPNGSSATATVSALNIVEAYNPSTNTWSTVASMPTAQEAEGAALGSDGRIYVVGGKSDSTATTQLNTVQAYNPTANTWATIVSLQTARSNLGVTAGVGSNQTIYAIAGTGPSGTGATGTPATGPLNTAESLAIGTSSGGGGGTTGPILTTVGGPNYRYIAQLYLDLLGRPVDFTSAAFQEGFLDFGQATRTQVAEGVLNSAERRTVVVEQLYQEVLGRPADPVGLAYYTGLLAQDPTTTQVEAFLLSSDEFFNNRGGGTNAGFLNALYEVVLGRPIDSQGAQVFGQILASGGSRLTVALTVLNSTEGLTHEVQTLYSQLLHRSADPTGLQIDVAALASGLDPETLVLQFVISPEYINNANANTSVLFVEQSYHDLLGRAADPAGLAAFAEALDAGTIDRAGVVRAIVNSTEYRTDQVEQLYHQLLGRPADAQGLATALAFLAAGGDLAQFEAQILGSVEFFKGPGGGSNAGFLNALYEDVLGRSIDPSGQQAYEPALDSGQLSRFAVAQAVLNSPESAMLQVTNLYTKFLHRAPDSTGEAVLVNALLQGEPAEQLAVDFVGSEEYLQDL